MGMNKVSYLGAYIVAKHKIIDDENVELVCPNGHNVFRGQEFCDKCGGKTIEKRTPTKKSLSLYDLMNEELVSYDFEDVMEVWGEYEEGIDWLVPNARNFGIRIEDKEDEIQISQVDIASEIVALAETYVDFIEAVKPHYDSVEIHYGIVSAYR
jgi:hypothetical protein